MLLVMYLGKRNFVGITLHWLFYYFTLAPNGPNIFYNQGDTFLPRNFNNCFLNILQILIDYLGQGVNI